MESNEVAPRLRNRVRELRENRLMTQAQLARKAVFASLAAWDTLPMVICRICER